MPNWCHCTLEVTGDEATLAAYVEHVRSPEQPLTFAACVPEPENIDDWKPENPSPIDSVIGGGWYGWRVAHWGTKWDASFGGAVSAIGRATMDVDTTVEAQGVQAVKEVAVYKFDTAWGPPTEWLERTATQHPQLSFRLRFGEVGNDVAGELRWEGGELVHDEELEVEDVLAPEEMWF